MYTVNLTVLIFLAVIAVAIGGIFGIMIGTLFRSATHKQRELTPRLHPVPPGLSSIVHLWRKKQENTLVLEFELEGLIEAASDLNEEQKIKLAQTVQELQRWIASPQTQPIELSTRPASVAAPSSANPVGTKTVQEEIKPVPVTLANVINPVQAKPKPVSTSIAAQINDILQEMLINTPLEKKGIRLFEIPEKGMVVLVGLDQYSTVDEVPDEIVRKVIKLAVQKWEKRVEKRSTPH